MNQSVNLYALMPKHFLVQLPAKLICILCGIFLLVLCSFSSYRYWQNHVLKGQVAEFSQQREKIESRLMQLQKSYAGETEIAKLSANIQSLQKAIQIKSLILQTLKHEAQFSFSARLKAFAQHVVPEVWLTRIEFVKAGESITLIGNAYALEAITQFIQNLEKDPIFSDYSFKLAKVVRSSAGSQSSAQSLKEELGFVIYIQTGVQE